MDGHTTVSEAEPRHQPEPQRTGRRKSTTDNATNDQSSRPSETSPLLNDTSREGPERDGRRTHSPPTWDGTAEFEGLPWWRTPSVAWLILPFLLLAMTYGATMVPLINVTRQLICREMIAPDADDEVCSSDKEVQAQVAMFQLYAQALAGALSAISSPKLGAWSDRYGRLRMLAITSGGMLAKDAFILAMYHSNGAFSVWWFLVAYAIDGICGSFTAGMAISHAYASDLTPPDRRATTFGWFHGSLFTGIAIGPLLAGYLVQYTGDLIIVFYIALGFHIFYLASLLLIPESLSKRRRAEAQAKHAKLRGMGEGGVLATVASADPQLAYMFKRYVLGKPAQLFEPLNILWPTGPGTSAALRKNLVILAAIDTITFGTAIGAMAVLILFLGYSFNWDTPETTKFVSIVNMSRVTCILVVLPVVSRLVRGRSASKPREAGCDSLDLSLIRVSVIFDTLGFVGYALAPSGGWIIAAGIVASVGGVGSPTLQSALTKHVPPSKVGQLLGATGLLHALARVVTPAVFNFIYARTVKIDMPATVFVVLAASFGIALVCSFFLKPGVYYDAKALERAEREEERQEALQREVQREVQTEEEEALI